MGAVQPGADNPATLKAIARHAEAIATVRAFAERSEALRVVLLLDLGDEAPAMLDAGPGGALELTDEGEAHEVPAAMPVPAPPRALPEIRPAPSSALRADPQSGELAAPIGAIANLGHAVLGLAGAFGGRSVATAEFATEDPDLPMTIVAREGEPLLLAVGDGRFELPLSMAEACTWCGANVEPWDGFRAYEPAGGRRAVFCRLEHVIPWAIRGAYWEAFGAETEEVHDGLTRCAWCEADLHEDHVALVRYRGEHRIPDGFCGVAHLLEWAKAGGRYRA